ncbi:unnamed protein product [Meloidogyne enterolobii]|uniref:Uncharacterized protein n=1 Tax=Meloidogyne enterolobii TaxID=390850 RepID=A0ACB0YTU9_MELEN
MFQSFLHKNFLLSFIILSFLIIYVNGGNGDGSSKQRETSPKEEGKAEKEKSSSPPKSGTKRKIGWDTMFKGLGKNKGASSVFGEITNVQLKNVWRDAAKRSLVQVLKNFYCNGYLERVFNSWSDMDKTLSLIQLDV